MTNDLPDVRERDGGPRPAPPAGGPRLSDVWVYNGRAYDLSEWISKHPGGAFFIGRTKNRDITAIVKSYHRDPAIVERILQRRYALGRDATPRDIHPKHNAPAFLFKDDFNSWRDTPKYRFDDPNDLLHRVKARLAEPALAARIKRMDTLFNAIVAVLAVGYFAVQGVRLVEPSWMPLWAFVIAMVLLRSSLAGFGHYALHRAQRGSSEVRCRVASRKGFHHRSAAEAVSEVSVDAVAPSQGASLGFRPRALLAGGIESQCQLRGCGFRRNRVGMNVSAESGAPRRAGQRHEVGLAQLPPAPPTTVAVIEGLATGTPRRVVNQSDAADRVAELFLDPGQRERIPRVYQKSRITTRRMAVDPLDAKFDVFRRESATIRDRMHLFYEHAVPLAVDVSKRALAGLPYRAAEIGLLVLATSTGFIAPGVDVAIVKELGLSPSISRVVVNFMGCAAAMNALGTATNYVRAHPAMKALVVCIELCSVNAVFADDINDVVIHSLFGDGCAALVIGASQVQEKLEPGKVVVRSSFSQLLDNTEDGIVLGVNHNGITCELSENLPGYIFSGVAPVVTEMLWDNGLQISDIDLWAIHPGGPKIIEQSVRSLGISAELAAQSWDVLARFGNMLSVSLIFVLETMVQQAESAKAISTGVAFAFGPGVTVEGMLFDIIRR